jgi:hypothetical protein
LPQASEQHAWLCDQHDDKTLPESRFPQFAQGGAIL